MRSRKKKEIERVYNKEKYRERKRRKKISKKKKKKVRLTIGRLLFI